MGLGSPSLRAFAASRELRSGVQEVGCKKWGARSGVQEVMRAKTLVLLGFCRMWWNSRYPDRVTICWPLDGMLCSMGIGLHWSLGNLW